MRKAIAGIAAAIFFVGLAGCSGGGGGGGGASGGGDTPFTYTGVTSAANLSATNAGSITANVVGSGDVSEAISVAAVAPDSGTIDVGRVLQRSVRSILTGPGSRKFTSTIPVEDVFACDSGQVHVFGTLNDNGTGTVQIQYQACRTGNVTASGSGSMRIDVFDFSLMIPSDFTVNFVRLTLSGSVAGEVSGSLRTRLDTRAFSITTTENLVARFGSSTMTKSENLIYVDTFSGQGFTETVNGRVFHSAYGYVDITTVLPFAFPTTTQDFPQSGQLLLTGAAGANILVTALSPSLVRLSLDIDGLSGFERVVTMMWTDLAGPVGADLGDTDGDGMHNSWELANGFDPKNAADAALDKDGDGATNLIEYLNGTRPDDRDSTPPSVGLSIAVVDSPDPVAIGSNLTYTITVRQNFFSANDVVLIDTLPTGVNLVSATTSRGSCNGATPTLTCNIGTMNFVGPVTVTVVVAPTSQGLHTNVATITTSSFDPDLTDNRATSVTLAGQPLSGIQAKIDAAIEGSTVDMAPGLYVGGLDFRGRNIRLRSSQGPAATILQGSTAGPAVRIGPSGAIEGFTITGTPFSRGMEVVGEGSLISGNIFEGQSGLPAIDGNGASPTIERNIFRNNSCLNQFLSAVVVFGNSSSPRIVNNLFVNNTCVALDLSLPQFNAPHVINNTFVNNRVANHVDRRVPQVTQVYRNNILANNGTGLEVAAVGTTDADNPVWSNNLLFGNAIDYAGANITGDGNISAANPLFVNQAAGNYDLLMGSPAIDVGSAVDAPTVDFEGVARVRVVDIGAFEGP